MKYVVIDKDNGGVVGPFDSEAEATAYFTLLARNEGWREVCDLLDSTGSPFEHTPDSPGVAAGGLHLEELWAPDSRTMAVMLVPEF